MTDDKDDGDGGGGFLGHTRAYLKECKEFYARRQFCLEFSRVIQYRASHILLHAVGSFDRSCRHLQVVFLEGKCVSCTPLSSCADRDLRL